MIKNKTIVIIGDQLSIAETILGSVIYELAGIEDKAVIISTGIMNKSDLKNGDRINYIIFSSKDANNILNIKKIDVLIVNSADFNLKSLYNVKLIINLESNNAIANSVTYSKPLKLSILIDFIIKNILHNYVFFCIDNKWIYDYNKKSLNSLDNIITFTEKENEVFCTLLSNYNSVIEKDYLKQQIWNYHRNSESNTVDTHLYKLKQKLPENFLTIKNSTCRINITNLE